MLDANLCDDSLECCEWGHHHIATWPGCCGSFARQRRSNWRRLSAFSPGRLFPSAFGETNPPPPSPARGRFGLSGAKHLEPSLLEPSSRYTAPSARKVRGELTGCLL